MKKLFLFLTLTIFSGALIAQDTLTGWTFPVNSGADSLNANLGTTQNMSYDLRFQWVTPNDTTMNTIFFTDGATSYAAATIGWDNCADNKYWSIKFKAPGYENIKVSSAQKSIYGTPAAGQKEYTAGPRDFKLQWKLSSGTFEDVPNGTITVANDWTTGKVTDLPVPVVDQGSSSVYLRWICTSNLDIYGEDDVTPNGISMIDDILVTGTAPSGTEDILYTNRVQLYPNPNNGVFSVRSTVPVSCIEVIDLSGKTVYHALAQGTNQSINLGKISKGAYILKVRFIDSDKTYSARFQID
jgi:hypothetical protein